MMKGLKTLLTVLAIVTTGVVGANAHAAPPPELHANANPDGIRWAPRFDFDTDGCYASVAIGRNGAQATGLRPTGAQNGNCRDLSDLDNSNTYHRSVCKTQGGDTYCAHMYALYFEKDQVFPSTFCCDPGHRHDIEDVIVYVKNNSLTHVNVSSHGDYIQRAKADINFTDGAKEHAKIVYHKDGVTTHVFRFGNASEPPENHKGVWFLPTLVSWAYMVGDGNITNQELRHRFNTYDFGSAKAAFNDSRFLNNVNRARPAGYPQF